MRTDLDAFHPAFRKPLIAVIKRLEAIGWQPIIASGWRTRSEQEKLKLSGRSRVSFSFHNATRPDGRAAALAADIVDRRHGWGGLASRLDFKFWIELGAAARAAGEKYKGPRS